jgi:hypothetical protein
MNGAIPPLPNTSLWRGAHLIPNLSKGYSEVSEMKHVAGWMNGHDSPPPPPISSLIVLCAKNSKIKPKPNMNIPQSELVG